MLVQNLIIFIVIATAMGYIGWQGYNTFSGRRSRLGKCCSKGCGCGGDPKPAEVKTQFIPADLIGRRRKP